MSCAAVAELTDGMDALAALRNDMDDPNDADAPAGGKWSEEEDAALRRGAFAPLGLRWLCPSDFARVAGVCDCDASMPLTGDRR